MSRQRDAQHRHQTRRWLLWTMGTLALVLAAPWHGQPLYAADTQQVGKATRQVESGAKSVGRGVEETAKGVGNTVVEGAKMTGKTLQEAGQSAQPHAEQAWDQVKDGAKAAGSSVQQFFHKVFGK